MCQKKARHVENSGQIEPNATRIVNPHSVSTRWTNSRSRQRPDTGIPILSGNFDLMIEAKDPTGGSSQKFFTLTIN
jgi:hypothetical protein